MVDEQDKLERYRFFVGQLRHEAELLWRVCSLFLLPLTALVAFLLSAVFGLGGIGISSGGIIFTAVIGLALCFVWFMSCRRSLEIFDLRRERIVELEAELPGWDLYRRRLRGWWRVRYGIYILVVLFTVVYSFILAYGLLVYFCPCIKE